MRKTDTDPDVYDTMGRFDEARFFRSLREIASPRLLSFLRSIDRRACVELAGFAINYVRRPEEKVLFVPRRRTRGQLCRTLTAAITTLRKAADNYRKVEEFQMAGGSLIEAGTQIWPEGLPHLAEVLDREADRLADVLKKCKQLYTEKRFGLAGNTLWLVLMQEFGAAWTAKDLGESQRFTTGDIACFVTAAKMTLGWSDERSETDPELIRKATGTFRSNPVNELILAAVPRRVQEHCHRVGNTPYLLGIEI